MKKTILISIGVLIIVTILSIWAYLFIYGVPQNSAEVFARFGVGGTAPEPQGIPETTVDVTESTVDGAPQKLRQLTTRPVAGAVFIQGNIRYVEQGTGHVYEINLATGQETLIEGTTIPQATKALFSSNGKYVAITALGRDGAVTLLEEIGVESDATRSEPIALPRGATNIAFGTATGTLMYTLKENGGSAGYRYNILKDQNTVIFRISLRDVRVLWSDPLYVYTTPTAYQVGHIYSVVKNNLVYVGEGSSALMAFANDTGIILTQTENTQIRSYALSIDNTQRNLPSPLIPEKCVPYAQYLYCGIPVEFSINGFPDTWYKGLNSFDDELWQIDTQLGTAKLMSSFTLVSGREIDVAQIGASATAEYIYIINKNDNSLWMFDTTL